MAISSDKKIESTKQSKIKKCNLAPWRALVYDKRRRFAPPDKRTLGCQMSYNYGE